MQLEREMDNLNRVLLKMADVVKKNIADAFSAYEDESNCTFINDDIVDEYERLIEEMCLDILIKERPYSRDLRLVSGILKLVSDLERIGDHAEDVMEFTLKLKNEEEKPCIEVKEMVAITLQMVNDAMNCYVGMDVELANDVIQRDDIIDRMYEEAVQRLIVKDSTRSYAINTTLVVKYIERIADHAVNIAEWVIYMVNGFHKDKKIF